MIKISHRGNIDGPKYEFENTKEYIDLAISQRYLVEIDIWKVDEKLYMTHDELLCSTTEVDLEYLSDRQYNIIIHCKNIEALAFFSLTRNKFHYFWHQEDDYILTSRGWIWCYPGKPVPATKATTICVLPEKHNSDVTNFTGICTDYLRF